MQGYIKCGLTYLVSKYASASGHNIFKYAIVILGNEYGDVIISLCKQRHYKRKMVHFFKITRKKEIKQQINI